MEKTFHSAGLENNKTLEDMSALSSMYIFQTEQENDKPVFPWAPTTNIQKQGASISSNLVDVDSELMNLTRKLSKHPEKQYLPGQGHHPTKHLQHGFFHQESSLLTNDKKQNRVTLLFL